MDIRVQDILVMKKAHPCGDKRWEVLRTGMDFRLRCLGCGHEHNCGVHGCAVLLAAEDAVVKLKAYVDLGFEPEEYKRTMSSDIIVRCAAAALGVSVEQLCEVVALGKAGRLMVLPDGEAMPSD